MENVDADVSKKEKKKKKKVDGCYES